MLEQRIEVAALERRSSSRVLAEAKSLETIEMLRIVGDALFHCSSIKVWYAFLKLFVQVFIVHPIYISEQILLQLLVCLAQVSDALDDWEDQLNILQLNEIVCDP